MVETFDLTILEKKAKLLCGINERFGGEPNHIQRTRYMFAKIMQELCTLREQQGRSEAGRNFSIAITELENACIRAIKGLYSIDN